jgi:hypothetical protein
MHLTLKKEATRPLGGNSLQQQARFAAFVREFNAERPHEALAMKCPAELGGYGHSFEWTPSRDFSVPYSISGASHANDDAFQHCRRALGY